MVSSMLGMYDRTPGGSAETRASSDGAEEMSSEVRLEERTTEDGEVGRVEEELSKSAEVEP